MISIIDSGKLVNTEANPMVPRSCEMVGLSTDDKPTGLNIGNGWSFIEMDTGKVYFYNAADSEWIEFAGSGGGGQGGNSVLVVHETWSDEYTAVLDKTAAEILAAYPFVSKEFDTSADGGYVGKSMLTQYSSENGHNFSFGDGEYFYAATGSDYPTTGS